MNFEEILKGLMGAPEQESQTKGYLVKIIELDTNTELLNKNFHAIIFSGQQAGAEETHAMSLRSCGTITASRALLGAEETVERVKKEQVDVAVSAALLKQFSTVIPQNMNDTSKS